jgi:hypothetical protein
VATAEAERTMEVMPIVGTSVTVPASALDASALERGPRVPMLGISVAWERDPFSNPRRTLDWRWVLGEWSIAPELELVLEPHRQMWLGGVRFEATAAWEPTHPDQPPIMRDWIVPHAGMLGDAIVVGVDYVSQLQLAHGFGVAVQAGANFWQTAGPSVAARGNLDPVVRSYWISQLTAGIALTMRL